MVIATSRYQARSLVTESGLAPVRVTLGRPRFELGYELAGTLMRLAPAPMDFRAIRDGEIDSQEFEARYLAKLDRLVDPAELDNRFQELAVGRESCCSVFATLVTQPAIDGCLPPGGRLSLRARSPSSRRTAAWITRSKVLRNRGLVDGARG